MDDGGNCSSSSSSPAPAVVVPKYELVDVKQEPNTELSLMSGDHNGHHQIPNIPLPQVAEAANYRSKFLDGTDFDLPEGWTVELRPRTNPKYLGRRDRFFYRPGTKKQFRSLNAAQKCAMEMKATEISQASMALPPAANQVPQISTLRVGQQFPIKLFTMEQPPEAAEGGSSYKNSLSVDPEIRKQIRTLRDAKRFARMKGKTW